VNLTSRFERQMPKSLSAGAVLQFPVSITIYDIIHIFLLGPPENGTRLQSPTSCFYINDRTMGNAQCFDISSIIWPENRN
jgi:hypothetical protein